MAPIFSTITAVKHYFYPPPNFHRFLDLPIELRAKILTMVLPTNKYLPLGPGPYFPTLENDRLLVSIPPVLQVSQQLRWEAMPIFYGENSFSLTLSRKHWHLMVHFINFALDDLKASCIKQLVIKDGEFDVVAEMFPNLARAQPGERLQFPRMGGRSSRINWADVQRLVWDEIDTENAAVRTGKRAGDTGLRRKLIARMMFIIGRDLGFIASRPNGLLKKLCESNEPGFE